MYNPKAFPSKDHEAESVNHIGRMNAIKNKDGAITGYMLTTYLDQSGIKAEPGDAAKLGAVDRDPHTTPGQDGIRISVSQADKIRENGHVIPTAANPDNALVSFSAPMMYIDRKDSKGRNQAMPNLNEIDGGGYYRTRAVKSEAKMLERFAASADVVRLAREYHRETAAKAGISEPETTAEVNAPEATAAAPSVAEIAAPEAATPEADAGELDF